MVRRAHAGPVSVSLVAAALCVAPACDRGREPTVAEEAAAAAARGVDRAKNERTLNRLEQLRTALTRYAIDHDGSVPEGSSLAAIAADLTPGYLPMLDAQDAWGNTLSYSSDGRSYTIVSAGPDAAAGTGDDITLRDGAVSGGS